MSSPSLLLWALLSASQAANVEKEIENKVMAFNQAYERNELDEYFSHYADDLTLWFDSGRVNLSEYKKSWYELIAGGGGVEPRTRWLRFYAACRENTPMSVG